jgi:pimeloyl-ACP methyl ester carboxylesterase
MIKIKGQTQMKHPMLYFKVLAILTVLAAAQIKASEPIDMTIDRDGILLKGKLYKAEKIGNCPTVILLHGFPGGDSDVLGLGKALSKVNFNVLTFNYSGTHKSEGEFNFDHSQKDIKAAFEFIHQSENIRQYKIDTTRVILGGYSFGGGMALTYAASHPEIKEVFSIAGNDHGEAVRRYRSDPERQKLLDEIFDELKPMTEVVRFGPGGTPKELAEMKIIELNQTYDLKYCAPLLAIKDILLIGGWDDHNVSIENIILPLYRALIDADAEHVTITAVQDDHSFKNSRTELAQIIIDWLNQVGNEVM